MRVLITYVIPTVAIVLVLILMLVRQRNPATNQEDNKPLVGAPLTILLLGISGTVGVLMIAVALDLLNFI